MQDAAAGLDPHANASRATEALFGHVLQHSMCCGRCAQRQSQTYAEGGIQAWYLQVQDPAAGSDTHADASRATEALFGHVLQGPQPLPDPAQPSAPTGTGTRVIITVVISNDNGRNNHVHNGHANILA